MNIIRTLGLACIVSTSLMGYSWKTLNNDLKIAEDTMQRIGIGATYIQGNVELYFRLQKSLPVSDTLIAFVQKECHEAGIPDTTGITIKQDPFAESAGGAFVFFNTIVLAPSIVTDLEYLLNQSHDNLLSEEQLRKAIWRAIIQHEAGHIRDRYSLKMLSTSIITGCVMDHIIERGLQYLGSSLSRYAQSPDNSWTALFAKDLMKTFAGTVILKTLARHYEHLADEGVSANPELLNALATYLEKYEENVINNLPTPWLQSLVAFITRNSTCNKIFGDHPLVKLRATRLRARAEEVTTQIDHIAQVA